MTSDLFKTFPVQMFNQNSLSDLLKAPLSRASQGQNLAVFSHNVGILAYTFNCATGTALIQSEAH